MRALRASALVALLALLACGRDERPPIVAAEPIAEVMPLGVLRVADEKKLILLEGKVGRIPGGVTILDEEGRPLPPARIALPLPEGARLELGEKGQLVLTRIADEPLRWIAVAHTRDEVRRREQALEVELAKLPSSLRDDLRPMKRVLALVSVCEGSFDGTATHAGDPAASLGIFQWAAPRRSTTDEGSSLSRYFVALKRRAVRCDESPAQRFFCDAWAQCDKAGLDVSGGRLTLGGRPATGEAIERALQPVMAVGPLRTYQLVAAKDFVDRVAAQPVTLRGLPRTVGEVLHHPRALATAVILGVNRPSWLVPALEQAAMSVGERDLDVLVFALRRAALARYDPAEREARAQRLLVSEVWW